MQTLTLVEVKANARDAWCSGKLLARNPSMPCEYIKDNGQVCAIGASMTDETLELIKAKDMNHKAINLLADSVVQIPDDEYNDIMDIQRAHDIIINEGSRQTDIYYFLSLIYR